MLQDQLEELGHNQESTLKLGDAGLVTIKTSGAIGGHNGFIVAAQFEQTHDHDLPGMHTLLQVCGVTDISSLPDWMRDAPGVTLRAFTASVEESEVLQLNVVMGTTSSWTLVDNFLTVEDLAVDFRVLSPFDLARIQLDLGARGRIAIGSAVIDVTVQAYDLTQLLTPQEQNPKTLQEQLSAHRLEYDSTELDELLGEIQAFDNEQTEPTSTIDFEISGSLVEPVSLATLFGHFGWQADGLFGGVEISELELSYDTRSGAYRFFIDVHHVLRIEVLSRPLELSEVSILVEGESGPDGGISGELGANIVFADTIIGVRAQCSGSDAGWLFEGQVTPIPIGKFISELKKRFGVQLPAFMESFTISVLSLSFHSDNNTFKFTCDGQLKIGTANVEALLTIDLSRNDTVSTCGFNGYLTVSLDNGNALYFDLDVHNEDDVTTLLAAYKDPEHSNTFDLKELVEVFTGEPPSGLPSLELNIPEAYVIHRSGDKAPEKNFTLFGLEIEGGLDLSQIKLPNLPLVSGGDEVSTSETLRLSFQALLADKNLKADDLPVALANEHELHLPEGNITAPGAINATLQIGKERQQLKAPINTSIDSLKDGGLQTTPVDDKTPPPDTTKPVDPVHWFKLQKTFGPVHMERVGLSFQDEQVSGLLDASFSIAGLTISLDGLTVSSKLKPIKPSFSLHGLGIDYRNEAIEIGGALLVREVEYKGKKHMSFAGAAILHAKVLTLSASGMYMDIDQHPSLFMYAVLDYPLGGPAFFFVTGLAASFGYNRTLMLPNIDGVADFPLITAALNSSPGDKTKPTDHDPMKALQKLESVIPPAMGEYFIAAGVRFSSFKMIDSFALLAVRMGHRFEIDLLGLSTLVHPPPEAKSPTTLAEIQLAIKATFVPEQGVLTVQALLTPESYFLSRDCHLTGGFAFFSWFKDQGPNASDAKAGDFVVTLGGYHPDFHAPAHYPNVPRLQLKWLVNEHLTIKGTAYYAITAQALMTGGSLSAVWQTTDMRAWFIASADFLIAWQPFHYDAKMQVSMGAEVTIHVFGTHHLSFDASAQLHLWGPEFAGDANVTVKVIGFDVSFNVAFGDHTVRPEAIQWEQFRQAFLPEQLCSASIQKGLLRSLKENNTDRWIVDPKGLAISIASAVPLTRGLGESENTENRLGIPPMAIEQGQFESGLIITVLDQSNNVVTDLFAFEPITKQQPAALWGNSKITLGYNKRFVETPSVNGTSFIESTLAGFTMRVKYPLEQVEGLSRDLGTKSDHVKDAFTWQPCQSDPLKSATTEPGSIDLSARNAMLRSLGFATEAISA